MEEDIQHQPLAARACVCVCERAHTHTHTHSTSESTQKVLEGSPVVEHLQSV